MRMFVICFLVFLGGSNAFSQTGQNTVSYNLKNSSLSGLLSKWDLKADRFTKAQIGKRSYEIIEAFRDKSVADSAPALQQLSGKSEACGTVVRRYVCRVGEPSTFNRVLFSQSPFEVISVDQAPYMFTNWMYGFSGSFVPSDIFYRTPFFSFKSRNSFLSDGMSKGSSAEVALAMAPLAVVMRGTEVFEETERRFHTGELFQCWSSLGICHQVWRLTTGSPMDASSRILGVCRVVRLNGKISDRPFDCLPITFQNEISAKILAVTEYFEIDGIGGSFLRGRVGFESQMSEANLRSMIAFAADRIGLGVASSESRIPTIELRSPGAVFDQQVGLFVKRHILVSYRIGEDNNWIIDLMVTISSSQFRGENKLYEGTSLDDDRAASFFVNALKQVCNERGRQTLCKILY